MNKSTIYCLAIQWTVIVSIFMGCGFPNPTSETKQKEVSIDSISSINRQLLPMKLDHINLAVANLEEAKDTYRSKLGFTLKEGRMHDNSILNAFAKFSDGSLIELITASEPKDELADWYVQFLKRNHQASAFAAFGIDSLSHMQSLRTRLSEGQIEHSYQEGGYAHMLSINHYERYHTPFFIHYTQPIIDQPQYLAHENGTKRILSFWLPQRVMDRELFKSLGWSGGDSVSVPILQEKGVNISMGEHAVYLFPDSSDQRVIGVSLEVNNLTLTQQVLEKGLGKEISIEEWDMGKSIFVRPEDALGIWLEFREVGN